MDPPKKSIFELIKCVTLKALQLVSLAKRYVWSARRVNRVSRALFHPEIASESNFDLESHFGLSLQHSLT